MSQYYRIMAVMLVIFMIIAQCPTAKAAECAISSARICYIDKAGYLVEGEPNLNYKVTLIKFPTWTKKNGQDDLIWHEGTRWWQNGKYYYYVNKSQHNNETGPYITHVYAYDSKQNILPGGSYGSGGFKEGTGIMIENVNQRKPCGVCVYDQHVYTVYNDHLSWGDAKSLCEKASSYLACITSQKENNAISKILGGNMMYFLGGQRETTSTNEWKWISGEPFSYTNLYAGQPDNHDGGETKLHMFSRYSLEKLHGYWGDLPPSENVKCGFVMETDLTDNTLLPVITKTYNGHTYQLYDAKVPWHTARAICEFKGGHLITINSAYEYAFLKELLAGYKKPTVCTQFFLGATDEVKEGTFKWVTNEKFDKNMMTFSAGKPDNGNGTGLDYLAINTLNHLVEDSCCDGGRAGFILETDSVKKETINKNTANKTKKNTGNKTVTKLKKGKKIKRGKLKYVITYLKGGNGKVKVLKPTSKKVKKIKIPGVVNTYGASLKVTEIASKAFRKCKKLKLINLGENTVLKKIGKKAFPPRKYGTKFKVPNTRLNKYKKLIAKAR